MIAVIVSYTVNPDFKQENIRNIQNFLADFQKMDTSTFTYNVHTKGDGNTFVHISTYKNKDVQTELLNVGSFKLFQQKRDESGLMNEPKIDVLERIGGTSEFK